MSPMKFHQFHLLPCPISSTPLPFLSPWLPGFHGFPAAGLRIHSFNPHVYVSTYYVSMFCSRSWACKHDSCSHEAYILVEETNKLLRFLKNQIVIMQPMQECFLKTDEKVSEQVDTLQSGKPLWEDHIWDLTNWRAGGNIPGRENSSCKGPELREEGGRFRELNEGQWGAVILRGAISAILCGTLPCIWVFPASLASPSIKCQKKPLTLMTKNPPPPPTPTPPTPLLFPVPFGQPQCRPSWEALKHSGWGASLEVSREGSSERKVGPGHTGFVSSVSFLGLP